MHPYVIDREYLLLATGASGFIRKRVVGNLLGKGFLKVPCLVRESSNTKGSNEMIAHRNAVSRAEVVQGNLLSRDDRSMATQDVTCICHVAAGTGIKAFSDAFLNSVVTTRNLLDAALDSQNLRRFVDVSSLAVCTNQNKLRKKVLDESCPVKKHLASEELPRHHKGPRQESILAPYDQVIEDYLEETTTRSAGMRQSFLMGVENSAL